MVLKLLDRIGIIGILIFSLVIKLILAFSTNLGNDEVYYVNFALYPNTSYFDHPPMVGWIIRAFTFDNALILNDFFVRLGAMLVGLINIFALYRIGILIRDKQTGILAAFLGSISFYVAIISGFFILPDTGLTLFWLLSIFTFIRYIKFRSPRDLIFFGLFVGLGMLSKYFSVYLWIGAFLYILKFDRKIFAKWQLWCSGFLSLLVFSPVIWWNLNSEYSGFNYHADRVGGDSWLPSLKFFFPEFFGQIFYNNPFCFYPDCFWIFSISKVEKSAKGPSFKFSNLLCSSFDHDNIGHGSIQSYFASLERTGIF